MSDADATLPLQKAIVATLKGNAAVNAIISGRVHDSVPASSVKPYISIGPIDSLPDVADEYEGSEITVQLDGWSAGPNSLQAKQLGAAIRTALHNQALSVEGHRLITLYVDSTRYLVEPDGLTQHAVVTLTARTEPTT